MSHSATLSVRARLTPSGPSVSRRHPSATKSSSSSLTTVPARSLSHRQVLLKSSTGARALRNTSSGSALHVTRRPACFSVAASASTQDYDEAISSARSVLLEAAETKSTEGDKVVDALLTLEKTVRSKAKEDPTVAEDLLQSLNGAWRLVFTTGTVDSQKKYGGRINYFPVKAAQCFDTSTMTLTNGIYIGDFALLKFFGPFEFNLKSRKLEFDFYDIAVFGFKFNLGRGGAADIGQATGLGSNNNKKLVESGKKPFFNWISADEDIATARGGGGGLALWRRDKEMEARNEAEKGQ
mmetsp:Transcript_43862/g.53053  ORF Transcript_43862/g.53053 Transcript_43862/m.53053 type:complete len:296 (-) Transcript_43862:274-1161(-)|eukprot:CAMPEP_0197853014 /NCGR_PEP_ID=MMETSP1438-20131217/21938_1 /TAXON_ID=1461541 /ORGANISM="Pterosperma sp., Strain CCMP1384" /LENGTH=295 /DNA_ID=CAMNT_0043467277 /DNA_START=163 /DNA_END=1050 /DNA_ORIENTATION=+